MLTAFLFPILVMVSSALVQAIFFKVGRGPDGDNPEFRFSKGVRIFCWIAVLLISLVPFAFGLSGSKLSMDEWYFFGVIVFFGVVCCVYAEIFTLKFSDDYLVIGAFKKIGVRYDEITSVAFESGGSGTTSLLIITKKRKFAISGYLGSLAYVEKMLKKKLSAVSRA